MSFLGFYYGKSISPKTKGRCGFVFINESQFNDLVEKFSNDYKYIVETEEYKNQWGYGFKYTLDDTHMILLNKYKDELDNDNSLIYFDDENAIIGIQDYYKIDCKDKQYKSLEEI